MKHMCKNIGIFLWIIMNILKSKWKQFEIFRLNVIVVGDTFFNEKIVVLNYEFCGKLSENEQQPSKFWHNWLLQVILSHIYCSNHSNYYLCWAGNLLSCFVWKFGSDKICAIINLLLSSICFARMFSTF